MNRIAQIAGFCLLAGAAVAAAAEERHVFAHYMTCFSSTPDFYGREIELAQRYGIDGFALNCGEWKKFDAAGNAADTRYVTNADRIFEQARKLGTDFRCFMSPDFAGSAISGDTKRNVTDMYRRYYDHPNLFRFRGKAFLSGYAGLPAQYHDPAAILRKEGREILVVPQAGLAFHPMARSPETVRKLLAMEPELDGIGYFTCDGTVGDLTDGNRVSRREALLAGKLCLAGVCPSYNSPNRRDFRGMAGYEAMWRGIIADDPEFVEIITWNDYQEDSNLMPFRWNHSAPETGLDREHFNRDESFLDVTGYFANYYKTGVAPEIGQDRLYVTSRNRPRSLTRVWIPSQSAWGDQRFDGSPLDQLHTDVGDNLYVSAFLTSPARLEVKTGKTARAFELPGGISHVELPFEPGVPEFRLTRRGTTVFDLVNRRSIVSEATKTNAVQGQHLIFREWTTGAAAGEPILTLKPEQTAFHPARTSPESWSLPDGIAGNSYCFRISFRNPEPGDDARLTLRFDTPGTDYGINPCYFPLFLPPTGKEERATAFLFTIPAGTSSVTLGMEKTPDGFDDRGNVEISSIQLIPLKHFAPNRKTPSPLVRIPGGSFRSGEREIALDPFAIGRCEVTNAEYERFFPEHRERRDSFSWRDRDPVIYVSWTDAARYCNRLSAEKGLKPAYDEQSWQLIPDADGFRLPSEAQWEYVATGRGENRRYPWGDEPPSRKHANLPPDPLGLDPYTRIGAGSGTTPAGSFPAGASRDGVLDLAGNVSEWCTDTYLDERPRSGRNPVETGASPYRSIRGSSFGYYNSDAENTAREFNHPGYPGYIYIGFRVALPEAGLKKTGTR